MSLVQEPFQELTSADLGNNSFISLDGFQSPREFLRSGGNKKGYLAIDALLVPRGTVLLNGGNFSAV